MTTSQLSEYIKLLKARGENVPLVPLTLALERKRATPLTPLVMFFVGVPLALGFGRRGAVVALVGAVGVGLGFWGVGVGLQQFGSYGFLPAVVAVWAPHLIFTAVGLFLLFRART